jgi:hypothetical protein
LANAHVLQTERAAHHFKDQASLTAGEALRAERVNGRFFDELRRALAEEHARITAE